VIFSEETESGPHNGIGHITLQMWLTTFEANLDRGRVNEGNAHALPEPRAQESGQRQDDLAFDLPAPEGRQIEAGLPPLRGWEFGDCGPGGSTAG